MTVDAISRVSILDVHVSCVDMTMAVRRITHAIQSDEKGYVCVSDVNALLHASADSELRQVFNDSVLTLPDGVPLVWAGRRAGSDTIERVCGPDLMPRLLEEAERHGWSSFFMGGSQETNDTLVSNLRRDFPDLRIAGHYSPPFRALSDTEEQDLMDRINTSGADIVWVGLGAPKQERWMASHRTRLDAPILIGVGGAFDMHAGAVARAPRWMQRSGLEWSYRLAKEPRRLWRRYFRNIPLFVARSIMEPPRLTRSP